MMSNPPDERLSTRALFEAVCALVTSEVDETEACHAHIALLQRRDPAEVWSLVAPLASSASPALRQIAEDLTFTDPDERAWLSRAIAACSGSGPESPVDR